MSYVPGTFEGGPVELYLQQELQRISEELLPLADGAMDKRHVLPEKPRSGLFLADGTNWDPGSGEGLYRYDEDSSSFVAIEGGAAGFSGLGTWRHRTEIAEPPASGQIRFDDADPLSATEVFVHETNVGASDMGNFLGLLTAGSLLFIQDKSNAANFFVVEISTNTDSGAYRTFGINNIVLEGTEPAQNQTVLLIISESGAGAAPVASVFGRTGAVTALQADYDGFFLTPTEGDSAYSALGHGHTLADISDSGALAALATVGTTEIDNNAVTLAKMVQVASDTTMGRVTAGVGNIEALTPLLATSILNPFTSALKGLAPASGGGTTNFMRADGTWAAPPSSAPVDSVFGRTGAVTALQADYDGFFLTPAEGNAAYLPLAARSFPLGNRRRGQGERRRRDSRGQ